ncbi:MAG: HlyD family efflux transporter periplasmic adaptor subunit, partial [Gammaproteobacteria bacterium]|nr:HlyD family efflux transporter periplasmic adaptor subunit [Gammaproteobacteria bacterium]
VLFLAEEYLFLGVAIGTWAVAMQIVMPLIRGLRFLFANPVLTGRRFRATTVSVLLIGAISAGLVIMPVSLTTRADGVVWVSDQARVYVGAEGFVTEVLVASGSRVETGTPVVRMRAPSLETHILKLEARRRELEIRSAADHLEQLVKSEITKDELVIVEAELALLKEQEAALLVRSKVPGTFVLPEEHKVKGRYLRQGDLIGYVFSPERLIVRTVVPQSDIGLVRRQVERVEVRFAERLGETVEVRIE